MIQVQLIIHGKVQGVFFRQSTKEIAKKLNVKGFVRNKADGTVEVIAQGPKKDIDELIRFCNRGPRGARVDTVEIIKQQSSEGFEGFFIR